LEESRRAGVPCAIGEWLRWRQQREFGAATTTAAGGNNTKRDVHVDDYAVRNAGRFHKKFSNFTNFINVGCEITSNFQPPAQFHLA
jgi:hypothetical protein